MALLRFALGSVALLLSLATAYAQTPDLSQASLEELMNIKVYTASRYLQSTDTAPSLITVVTADQIQKYGYRTLADILRSVGGFYVSYDRNYSFVGVRGFNRAGDYNTRVLLLMDGHRLNDNVDDWAYVGTEFILDIDLIDRVEVVQFPTSSLYGSNAFLAVVNVITRSPAQVNGAEFSSEAGSFNSYKGRATYGGHFQPFQLLLSGTYYTSIGQNLFFPEFNTAADNFGVAVHGDDDRYRSLFAKLQVNKLTFRGAYHLREKGIPTASFGDIFNNSASRTFDIHRFFDAQYQTTFRGDWEVSLRASYDFYHYWGSYMWADPALPNPILNSDHAWGEWWGGEARLTHVFRDRHRITAGLELRDNLRQDQQNYDVQPFSPYFNQHYSSWLGAFYLQDELSLNSRSLLNLGIRYDQYSTFGGTTNPRLALIYQPRKTTALKLLYGTAFRAPNVYELYLQSNTQIPNPGLRPETISTAEVVLEQTATRHLHLAASAYHNQINALISQFTDPLTGMVTYRNRDKVSSNGLELQLIAKWLSGLEGHASYNLQHTTDGITGQALTNSPVHLAKLGLIVPVVRNSLFASLDSWCMSRRRTLSGSSVGGFAVFNATLLSRNLGKHAEISASLYNLFDKNYADPGAEEHMQDALRQDGRNFRVKLTFHF